MPRGQHGFQKQVAVVVAPCAVAGLGQLGNQVERGGFGLAGEYAVVQAEQADGVEGQRAHRHHAAKGDAAAQEAGFAGLVQEVLRVFAGGVGVNLLGELRHIGLCLPVGQRAFPLLVGLAVGIVGGGEQVLAQTAQAAAPLFDGGGGLPFVFGVEQELYELHESGEDGQVVGVAVESGGIVPQILLCRLHPTQHQPVQPLLPGKQRMVVAVLRAFGFIAAPADIQLRHGFGQQRQIVARELPLRQDGRIVQQRQHFFHFKSAAQHFQRLGDGIECRLLARQFHIGNRIRQRRVGILPEHGFDKRRIRLDIRREHGNVTRLPRRVLLQHQADLVF